MTVGLGVAVVVGLGVAVVVGLGVAVGETVGRGLTVGVGVGFGVGETTGTVPMKSKPVNTPSGVPSSDASCTVAGALPDTGIFERK